MTDDWQSQKFRQNVISKIHDLLPPNADKNAGVIEDHIFRKSRTKDEYLGLVAKLFILFKDMSRKSQQQQQQQQQQQGGGPPPNPEQDPLNALQNLAIQDNPSDVMDMPVNPNEPTNCLCHQVSYGEMIGCDNPDCPIQWFHFACVGLTTKPNGKWFCPKCTQDAKY